MMNLSENCESKIWKESWDSWAQNKRFRSSIATPSKSKGPKHRCFEVFANVRAGWPIGKSIGNTIDAYGGLETLQGL